MCTHDNSIAPSKTYHMKLKEFNHLHAKIHLICKCSNYGYKLTSKTNTLLKHLHNIAMDKNDYHYSTWYPHEHSSDGYFQ